MSRKEQEQQQQPKQRCKECGRKVGVQGDGKLVQHKCEKARKEKK